MLHTYQHPVCDVYTFTLHPLKNYMVPADKFAD